MSEYDEFSRRAAFCLTFASTITDHAHKAALVEMPERWRELAEQARAREAQNATSGQEAGAAAKA